MTLNFPNESRSFDHTKEAVRFWGHDSALEISFFVAVSALLKLDPHMPDAEPGYLETFDSQRDRVHAAARKAYTRSGRDAYLLSPEDF